MEFEAMVKLILRSIPEFQSFDKEDLDDDLPYLFLSAFGTFTRDAIANNEPYATKCLNFINNIVHQCENDADFMGKMQIGVLEFLTDYVITQKEAIKHFNGHCLQIFTRLIKGGHFRDLTGTP